MPLIEHLRELRTRLFKSVVAIVLASILAAVFYDQIFDLLQQPYVDGVAALEASGKEVDSRLVFSGIAEPFTFTLKISLVAGLVISSPVWLWQIWAFVVPALHRKERKWSMVFGAVAAPLFLLGTVIGYYVLPKGIEILFGFTPSGVSNFNSLSDYLSFVLRIILVFAIAFEIPVFVVLLNLVGVVSGKALGNARPWIFVGTFVFAAIATPTTDPITMLFLAIPMCVLFVISEVIARLIDRRRARDEVAAFGAASDDEISPIQLEEHPEDHLPSRLDDE